MTQRTILAAALASFLLLPLAPLAGAGHVQVYVNPCESAEGLPRQIPGCRDGQPIDGCWTRGERGEPIGKYDPSLCPDANADASCVALGLHARDSFGLVTVQNSRSAAQASAGGAGQASANLQRVDATVASEGTLLTQCSAGFDRSCGAFADARAASVSLLGGFVQADALEAVAGIDCFGTVTQDTKVSRLLIGGTDYGDLVHPSTILVPGVARVVIGETSGGMTPTGGFGVSATALRVDVLDPFGNTVATVRVSHAAAAMR